MCKPQMSALQPPCSLHLLDHLQLLLFTWEEAPYPIVQQVPTGPTAPLKNLRNQHKSIPANKLAARSCIHLSSFPLSLKCLISSTYSFSKFLFYSHSFLSAKMPDLFLHLYSLSVFPLLLRLCQSSKLFYGKLRVCLGKSGLATGNLTN